MVWGSSPYQGNATWWIYMKTRTSKLWTQGVNSELVKLCLCLSVFVCSLPTLCSDHGNQPQWCGVCVLFMIPIDSSGLNLLLWVFQGSIMEYCQQVKGNFIFVKSTLWKLTSASKSEIQLIIIIYLLQDWLHWGYFMLPLCLPKTVLDSVKIPVIWVSWNHYSCNVLWESATSVSPGLFHVLSKF